MTPVREDCSNTPAANSVCTPAAPNSVSTPDGFCATPKLDHQLHYIFKGETPPVRSGRVLVEDTFLIEDRTPCK